MMGMTALQVAELLTETATPRTIGAQMAQLRMQFNLTPQEVSERLHIRTRYVTAIEEGRYDVMPGKVYARGYVHTYAEFLGMDANQIVAQCFAGDAPANAQPLPPQARSVAYTTARTGPKISSGQWRGYAVFGVVALAVVLLVSQLGGPSREPEAPVTSVAPVPDVMLASVRNLIMPTAGNYTCLTRDVVLACFFADHVTQSLSRLDAEETVHFGGEIDVFSAMMTVAEPAEGEAATDVDTPAPAEETDHAQPPTDDHDDE